MNDPTKSSTFPFWLFAHQGPPNYKRLFKVLDDAGIRSAEDMLKKSSRATTVSPITSIVSEALLQSVSSLLSKDRADLESIRIISDAPSPDVVAACLLLAERCFVLSDSEAAMWQSEIANPVHTEYYVGLLDVFFRCRDILLADCGDVVVAPALVKHRIGRDDPPVYTNEYDFTASLAGDGDLRVRAISDLPDEAVVHPEALSSASADAPMVPATQLLRIRLPAIFGERRRQIVKVIREESEALRRFRYALRDSFEPEELTTSAGLRAVFEKIDYEASRLEQEYRAILRKRERSLAGAALGFLGVTLAVTLPPSLVILGKALGAAAAGVNSLNYVFSVRDTLPELRRDDYYVAWRALRK